MKRLEKHLERSLDYSISDTRMGRVPFSEPWYMGFQTRQEKESQEKVMIEILTRVAVYRKTHPAISPWLLPGESSYDDLMAYLPHDNTEVAHDNSTLISHEGEQ